jgi:hypothetical protein
MAEETPRKRLPIRWLSLGEIVAVAAVLIAGLGYWDSHRERDREATDKAAAARERAAEERAAARKQTFILTGTPEDSGSRLRLAAVNPEQVIQTQTLLCPTPVRGEDVQTTGNPRLERRWFQGGLKKARGDKANSGRVPVGIITTYIEAGETRSDRSIYQLGYSLHERTLRPDEVELEGLSLARRAARGDQQAAVDSLWERAGH